MDIHEKEQRLISILKRIEYLGEELRDTRTNYYVEYPKRINGRITKLSLSDIVELLIRDYQREVLESFYEEVERVLSQSE